MSVTSKFKVLAFTAVLAGVTVPAVLPATADAQNQGGGGGGQGGGRGQGGGGGGGGGGWQQMQQQRMDQMKEDLAASDDEFPVIQAKIEKIQEMQRASMMANFRGGRQGRQGRNGGGQGGQGGQGGDNTPASPVVTAKDDLTTTLKNKDAKPEDVKAKLDAYRAAKTKAKDDLTKAQDDLKGTLTARQEAVMVEYGVLD